MNAAYTRKSLIAAISMNTDLPESGLQSQSERSESETAQQIVDPLVTASNVDKESSDTLNGTQHEGNGDAAEEESPVIDIAINNVVSAFGTKCHLNLRRIGTEGVNVEYKRANGMVNMKIRHPQATATIWSSGKLTCTGSTSEDDAKVAARKFARILQRMGFSVKFSNFRVVNVLGTCSLPFGIRLNQFTQDNHRMASYEPELHPAVTYRIKEPKATLKIFSTGSITVTAPRVANIQSAIEYIFPLVYPHKMEKRQAVKATTLSEQKKYKIIHNHQGQKRTLLDSDEEDSEDLEESHSEDNDSDFDSDESCD